MAWRTVRVCGVMLARGEVVLLAVAVGAGLWRGRRRLLRRASLPERRCRALPRANPLSQDRYREGLAGFDNFFKILDVARH